MTEITREQLLEMVTEYEATLRYIFDSWRDRRALAMVHPTPENRGEVFAFRDMSRYALESLRRFHPDEKYPIASDGSWSPTATGKRPTRKATAKGRGRTAAGVLEGG